MKVETHDGTAYQTQAEMMYDGQGRRLGMTAWQGSLSLTTAYLVDAAGVVRAATADSQTTYYAYGLGVLGEKKEDWSYYLNDGFSTTRQMSDATGYVILSRSFTPWGELLELHGEGDFSWGYLGGLLDAATGLIYMGSGQYYDPATGRFLTRGVYPGSPNPYVPWRGDPLGMILGPLALLALVRGKRKAGRIDQFLALGVILLALGATVAGCSYGTSTGTVTLPAPSPTLTPTLPPTQTVTPAPTQTATVTVTLVSATSTPTSTVTHTVIVMTCVNSSVLPPIRPAGLILSDENIWSTYEKLWKKQDSWWWMPIDHRLEG